MASTIAERFLIVIGLAFGELAAAVLLLATILFIGRRLA